MAAAEARDWRLPLIIHVVELLDDAADAPNRRLALELLATTGRANLELYHPAMLRRLADSDWSVRSAARRALAPDSRAAGTELGRRQLAVTRAAAAECWEQRGPGLRLMNTLPGFEGADQARADKATARRRAIA